MAQAFDALAIGILRLQIAQLGLIAHADVPFAERQPYLCLIQCLYTYPLAPTLLAPDGRSAFVR